MKIISFGGVEVLAADDVAYATIDYATALASAAAADNIDVPAIDTTGAPTTVTVLLSPTIPVLVRDSPDDTPEHDLADDAEGNRLLEDIRWRTATIRLLGED